MKGVYANASIIFRIGVADKTGTVNLTYAIPEIVSESMWVTDHRRFARGGIPSYQSDAYRCWGKTVQYFAGHENRKPVLRANIVSLIAVDCCEPEDCLIGPINLVD